eukprot:TRINITY_DN3365_c0_g1_i2.p3 TRINITY_DN3365_c0_g1~~TRINITY_DN3365_c0_g1_i2.p3  ORF type:complete len:113 (+),score=18.15 TRINITY_DN3365_c0_g1_i2:108-446(+)
MTRAELKDYAEKHRIPEMVDMLVKRLLEHRPADVQKFLLEELVRQGAKVDAEAMSGQRCASAPWPHGLSVATRGDHVAAREAGRAAAEEEGRCGQRLRRGLAELAERPHAEG